MAKRGARFYVILAAAFFLTLAAFAGAVILSLPHDPSDLAKSTADKLLGFANLGLGSVLGLIGGKTLA